MFFFYLCLKELKQFWRQKWGPTLYTQDVPNEGTNKWNVMKNAEIQVQFSVKRPTD